MSWPAFIAIPIFIIDENRLVYYPLIAVLFLLRVGLPNEERIKEVLQSNMFIVPTILYFVVTIPTVLYLSMTDKEFYESYTMNLGFSFLVYGVPIYIALVVSELRYFNDLGRT